MQAASPLTGSECVGVDAIRACFPALERRHRGRPVAYFDGPGGTQTPRDVVEAMVDYLYHHNANTHWRYPSSVETDAMIGAARAALADFLGGTPEEIAFGANMTTLTFHLARALGRTWKAGDEIVITELDHHANVAPWEALARERGVTLVVVPFVAETGQLDWPSLEAALSAAGPGFSPSAPRRTRWGRSATSRGRARWPGVPAPSASWTPCTTPRTTRWTSPVSAAISSPARRTSSTAPTLEYCTGGGRSWSHWTSPRSPRRRIPRRSGWRRAP